VHAGWHAVFWFLAGIGVLLWVSNWFLLPETLHVSQRQALSVRHLMRGYWQLGTNPRFLLLALASGIPFNGMFLYVLSAPTFLGQHLQLAPRSSSGSSCARSAASWAELGSVVGWPDALRQSGRCASGWSSCSLCRC